MIEKALLGLHCALMYMRHAQAEGKANQGLEAITTHEALQNAEHAGYWLAIAQLNGIDVIGFIESQIKEHQK